MVEVFCGILAGAHYSNNIRTWKVTDRVANLVRDFCVCRKNTSVVSCLYKFLCQYVVTKKSGECMLTQHFKKKTQQRCLLCLISNTVGKVRLDTTFAC